MSFRKLLTARREELGLSKTALARLVKVSDVHVNTIESGRSGVSLEVIGRLESALGFTNHELVNAWIVEKNAGASAAVEATQKFGLQTPQLPMIVFNADQVAQIHRIREGEAPTVPRPTIDLKKPIGFGGREKKPPQVIWLPWGTPYGRVAVKIQDDDMGPEIRRGDIIVVDTKVQPKNGSLVMTERGKKVTVRRYTHDGTARILEAFDRAILPMHLKVEDKEAILGVVVAVLRDYADQKPV